MIMDMTNGQNITFLSERLCLSLPLELHQVECSLSHPNICVSCNHGSAYITGYPQQGQLICKGIWILTVIAGLFGIIGNSIIIAVLGERKDKNSFDFQLLALACFDMLVGLTSIISSTTLTMMIDGNLGLVIQNIQFYTLYLFLLARSGSTFTTVLLTVERYCAIAFPLHSRTWFSRKRTKIWIGLLLTQFSLVTVPRFLHVRFEPVGILHDVPSLKGWDYIPVEAFHTELSQFSLRVSEFMIVLEFLIPPPLLILFNVLACLKIREFARKRARLTQSEQKGLQAFRLLIPVVVVLLLSNLEAYFHFYHASIRGIFAREHVFGVGLSVAVNSSVNLPIYYFASGEFKKGVRSFFSPLWKRPHCARDGGMENEGVEMELYVPPVLTKF